MSRPEIVALGREFGPRDRYVVKVEAEEFCGVLFEAIGVQDTEGRIRFGVIEVVEFRAVTVPRHWWWPLDQRETKRRIRVRFER